MTRAFKMGFTDFLKQANVFAKGLKQKAINLVAQKAVPIAAAKTVAARQGTKKLIKTVAAKSGMAFKGKGTPLLDRLRKKVQ